jgi:outer membrane receptor protein involved in Fe transport
VARIAACAAFRAACLAAALSSGHARADGQHDERIEVIGHYENAVGTSDAASQGYITPRLIEARPISRPGEVLEYVPGLIVTQHSGEGKANQFFLRGFNLDHGTDFATSIAGVPVNMPTHAHGQGYSDLNFLIPELISRIDYRKGPYFASEGDFSSAGAAHFHYYDKLKEGFGSITLGSFRYKRALVADSKALSNGDLLFAFEALDSNGPWDVASHYGKQNAVLRYSLGAASDRHMFTLMAYQGSWTATDQIAQRAVDQGLIGRFGSLDPTDGGNSQRYSLSYERRRAFGNGEFQLNAYAMRYRMQLFSNFTYFLNDPVNGDQFEQADRRTVVGIAPAWVFTGRLWERESTVKLGLNLRRDQIGTVGLYDTAERQRLAAVREDRVGQTSLGGYVEHSLQWNEWFRSVLGARADFYRFNVRSDLAVNSGREDAHRTSPKIRLIFGPFARTEYFVSAGYGFHSNDGRGVLTRIDPATGLAVQPAPALVRSKGEELGVRSELIPNLQTSLALWRLSLNSELLFVGDAGTTEASRPSRRQGVEWSNRYLPRPWLIIDADLSVSKARFRGDDPATPGNHIPGSIDRVATLGASLDSLGPWSGSLQSRYFGPRPLTEDDSVRSRSTLLWNMRVGYKVDRHAKLTLDVLNLFDRKANDIDYFYCSRLRTDAPGSACGNGTAGGVDDIHFHPVEPRAMRLTLTVGF